MDGDHDLRPGLEEASEIVGVGAYIVHDHRSVLAGRLSADPSVERDPGVLGRLGPFPGVEDELLPVEPIDPDPRIVRERVSEEPTDLFQRLAAR